MTSATRPDLDDPRAGILDAAARLLRADGVHALTTRAVAHAAGVAAPALYRLFGDKDGLLDALAEHVMAAFVAEKAAAAGDPDPDPVRDLRASWRRTVEFGLANPELFALIVLPGRPTRSPAAAAGIEMLRSRVRRVAAAGLLGVDEQRAVDMIHACGVGAVLAVLARSEDDRDPSLADAMFDALAGAILTDGPAAPDPGLTAVAVMFATVVPDLPALTDAERALMTEWLRRSLTELGRRH